MENHPLVPGQLRASAHTDYGTITILKTDAAGLQVSKDTDSPDWVDVPYVPSGYIINLGDLMARWTNDKWVSTLHRVVNPAEVAADDCLAGSAGNGTCAAAQSPDSFKKTRRQSIAFFYNVNPDAVIESLPSRYVEDGPGKYPAVVAGDFLLMKHLAANPHLAEEEAESQA
jgi:isopenicillin N synthase-like dioxygenase